MKKTSALYKKLPLICLVLSLAIFALSMSDILERGNIERAAEKTSEKVAERIAKLNSAVNKVLSVAPESHSSPEHFDEDIVVYRYVNDSLTFWCNLFPILNDNISQKMVFHRLSPYDNRIESPLINVTGDLKYMNIGTKWYLVKCVEGAWNDKVIAGLEIKNGLVAEDPLFHPAVEQCRGCSCLPERNTGLQDHIRLDTTRPYCRYLYTPMACNASTCHCRDTLSTCPQDIQSVLHCHAAAHRLDDGSVFLEPSTE